MSIHSRLYQIAEQQGGYFSSGQACQAGLSKALLSYHVRQGRLLSIRRGIYRLAEFPETPYADLIVAWLAAGEKAIVSHEFERGMVSEATLQEEARRHGGQVAAVIHRALAFLTPS